MFSFFLLRLCMSVSSNQNKKIIIKSKLKIFITKERIHPFHRNKIQLHIVLSYQYLNSLDNSILYGILKLLYNLKTFPV